MGLLHLRPLESNVKFVLTSTIFLFRWKREKKAFMVQKNQNLCSFRWYFQLEFPNANDLIRVYDIRTFHSFFLNETPYLFRTNINFMISMFKSLVECVPLRSFWPMEKIYSWFQFEFGSYLLKKKDFDFANFIFTDYAY